MMLAEALAGVKRLFLDTASPFLTNDRGSTRVTRLKVLVLDDLEGSESS